MITFQLSRTMEGGVSGAWGGQVQNQQPSTSALPGKVLMNFLFQYTAIICSHIIIRVRTGFGKSWKVLEIDNGFFQDLESFGKWIFGPLGYGKVIWIFLSLSSLYLAKNCFFLSALYVCHCLLQYCFALVNVECFRSMNLALFLRYVWFWKFESN
jgi:hypothetical protein